jgi:hypothetical protein
MAMAENIKKIPNRNIQIKIDPERVPGNISVSSSLSAVHKNYAWICTSKRIPASPNSKPIQSVPRFSVSASEFSNIPARIMMKVPQYR